MFSLMRVDAKLRRLPTEIFAASGAWAKVCSRSKGGQHPNLLVIQNNFVLGNPGRSKLVSLTKARPNA
jgi:hypothetical protein